MSATVTVPDIRTAARRISGQVAALHAADVDENARIPIEALAALRSERLLGAAVPARLGGFGLDVADVAAVTAELAHGCASTAMIFAMHQIQVFCLVRHGRNPALLEYLRRVAAEQLLLASATTEIGRGGDVRTSTCAVELKPDGGVQLDKTAPVISYGQAADALLATARRTPDSAAADQVLMLCTNGPGAELRLRELAGWDSMGMRGTCSCSFAISATGPAEHVLDDSFELIASATMLPVAHLLWSSVWSGIASQAFDVAHRFVRAEARKQPGVPPPAALRLAEAHVLLQQLRQLVSGALDRYRAKADDFGAMSELGFMTAMNALKVATSTQAIEVVTRALAICGVAGYRNDSPYSVTRAVRDAYAAVVMIGNDRILHNNAQLLLGPGDIR